MRSQRQTRSLQYGPLLAALGFLSLGCDDPNEVDNAARARLAQEEVALEAVRGHDDRIAVRVVHRGVLSATELSARFPKPQQRDGETVTGQIHDESCTATEPVTPIVMKWKSLPPTAQDDVSLPTLQPILSIVNVGTEVLTIEPMITADAGGPQEWFGGTGRSTIRPGEEIELEADIEALSLDFDAMLYSGLVRANSNVWRATGDALESVSSDNLFYHKRGSSFLAYNEKRLRQTHRGGDFAQRIPGQLPPGLRRMRDGGPGDPTPPEDGDSGGVAETDALEQQE